MSLKFRQHVGTAELLESLSHLSKPHDALERLVRNGDYVRLCRGHYVPGVELRDEPLCLPAIANAIYGPSYVSFEFALSRYGIIPERVSEVTSATLVRSRRYETPVATFSYKRMSRGRYAPGIVRHLEGDVPFLMASPEKALVDKIWLDLQAYSDLTLVDPAAYLIEDLRLDLDVVQSLDLSFLQQTAARFGTAAGRFVDWLVNEAANG